MTPTIFLPGENDPISRSPEKLAVRYDRVEYAAVAVIGHPHLMSHARCRAGHANRPRFGAAHAPSSRARRRAHERYLLTVRRPHGIIVAIDARIQICKLLGRKIINGDEAM